MLFRSADHGVACGEELLGEGVDVPELGIAVGVLVSFQGLAGPLRLIQDSAIDLVRPILSCNDQPSIKIAE